MTNAFKNQPHRKKATSTNAFVLVVLLSKPVLKTVCVKGMF